MACFKSLWEGLFIASFPKEYKLGLFRSLYFNCKVDVNISWKSKHLVGRGGNRGWNVGWFWKACRDNSNDPERKALFMAEGSGKVVSPFPWLDKGTGLPFQSICKPKTRPSNFLTFQSIFHPSYIVKNTLISPFPRRGGLVTGSRIDGAIVTATVQSLEPSLARRNAAHGAAPDDVEDDEPDHPRVQGQERRAASVRVESGTAVVYTTKRFATTTTLKPTTTSSVVYTRTRTTDTSQGRMRATTTTTLMWSARSSSTLCTATKVKPSMDYCLSQVYITSIPTAKTNRRAPLGLHRTDYRPLCHRHYYKLDIPYFRKDTNDTESFNTHALFRETTEEPSGLFHSQYEPRRLFSHIHKERPFTDMRDVVETQLEVKPSVDGRLTVEGAQAHGPVHGDGQERLAAHDRDGRRPDDRALAEGQERHAALYERVQHQLSYQVGITKSIMTDQVTTATLACLIPLPLQSQISFRNTFHNGKPGPYNSI